PSRGGAGGPRTAAHQRPDGGRPVAPGMTPDELVAEACQETGLDEFGRADFREGLAVYCESALSEAKLNEVGVIAVRGNMVATLANRLRVVDWAARHPDVADERIDA